MRIYELMGRKGELNAAQENLRMYFEKGLSAYRNRDWENAKSNFKKCLDLRENDKPSSVYLRRIQHVKRDPPPPDWDGVWIRQFQIDPPPDDWDGVWKLTKK